MIHSLLSLHPTRLRVLLLCLGLLANAGPADAKARYLHATTDNIDMVSAMSEERTTRFLHELVGLRKIVEDLLDTPVAQPATQVIVFDSQVEMNEFFPRRERDYLRVSTKWVSVALPEGEVFSIISDWPNDKVFRQAALKVYASRLISRTLPECPFWIYEGLAAFLCTLEYRDGTVRLGESSIDRPDLRLIFAKRLPLAETLGKTWGSKDVPGLWHLWLTQDYEGNRPKIRRLAERIRQGAPGNADTVSEAFGEPVADIQAALYKHMKGVREVTVDRPALTADLLGGITYQPATELEMTAARSLILLTLEQRPPALGSWLASLAQAYPDSPRPLELQARLAAAEADTETADDLWLQACAKNTANSYGYLVPLRRALEPRISQVNLRPSLTPARATELRQIGDTCVALNPGLFEGFQWLAWTEALAPDPQADRVDRVQQTHARFLRPGICVPLVIANIRLKRFAQATALLDEYEKRVLNNRSNNRPVVEFLRKQIP